MNISLHEIMIFKCHTIYNGIRRSLKPATCDAPKKAIPFVFTQHREAAPYFSGKYFVFTRPYMLLKLNITSLGSTLRDAVFRSDHVLFHNLDIYVPDTN